MNLSFSPTAARQIREIYAYIAQHNPRAAREVVDRIMEVGEFAAAYPSAGHATVLHGIRAIPATPYPYVVYLRKSKRTVRMLRVLHAARQRPELRDEAREFIPASTF